MKWSEMEKTTNEDEYDSDDSEAESKVKEPIIRFEQIPHKGSVNRIRTMNHSNVVATWNEDGEVGVYDITPALEELDNPSQKKTAQKKVFSNCKLAGFKHQSEGYALEWSPSTFGRLASGNNDAQLNLYESADATGSSFVKTSKAALSGH